jgi:Protein tyrosine and serine/threonine kinase
MGSPLSVVTITSNHSQKLFDESRIWKRLSHPNVLQLHGVFDPLGPSPGLVSPWMENGDITKYLSNQERPITISERLSLVWYSRIPVYYNSQSISYLKQQADYSTVSTAIPTFPPITTNLDTSTRSCFPSYSW